MESQARTLKLKGGEQFSWRMFPIQVKAEKVDVFCMMMKFWSTGKGIAVGVSMEKPSSFPGLTLLSD